MHSSGINVYKVGCHLHRNETLFHYVTSTVIGIQGKTRL